MRTLCTQRIVRPTAFVVLLVGMLWLVLARAGTVQAAGVVGSGTPGSCTDTALTNALAAAAP